MLFWWFVLAVFWFVVGDDGFLDYVQVLHQFSFVALNQQTASRINLEINAFAMPLSVLNDLAEAMKALDGKKGVDIHVQAAGSQICLQNICGQQRNSPMADPIFASKYGPQNWITFSFLLLGLCVGPVLGSRFGPKSGASHRKILLLPADVLQADLRRTGSVSVNACLFSVRPNLLLEHDANAFFPSCRKRAVLR